MKLRRYEGQEDKDLILWAQEGDEKAFEELVKRYSNQVINLSSQIMGSSDEGWDMAQEVFISVWKNIKSFDRDKNFYPWIRKITINACYEELRRRKRERTISLDNVEDNEPSVDLPDITYSPEEIFDKKEINEVLATLINTLPEHYRITLWLRVVEDLSYEEIAQQLNINIGTVKSRINMARKLMKEKLSMYYMEEKDETSSF
jgi:RNA polymerase sigma-70 factor (ECF subfamily)